jgi:hypothetical protein
VAGSTRTPSANAEHLRRVKRRPRLPAKARLRAQQREVERMFWAEPELAAVTFAPDLVGKPHGEPLTPAEYREARGKAFGISRMLWGRGPASDAPRSREEIAADIDQVREELAELRRRLG